MVYNADTEKCCHQKRNQKQEKITKWCAVHKGFHGKRKLIFHHIFLTKSFKIFGNEIKKHDVDIYSSRMYKYCIFGCYFYVTNQSAGTKNDTKLVCKYYCCKEILCGNRFVFVFQNESRK